MKNELEKRALFVFTPPESKRFIAKAVARLPEVKRAKADGEIVIGHGSTNVRVAQEILGLCPEPDKFISGLLINGILCVTQAEEKPPMVVIRKGELVPPEPTMEEVLANFGQDSVFIKGANAIDPEGNVGVYVAHPSGGTIGFAYGILSARGCPIIAPVGLEKLIPSVKEAANHLGQKTLYYSTGIRIGMIPMMNARAVTEIDAFRILFDVRAVYAGGGGLSGSEGSVVIVAEGRKDRIDRAIDLIESIKGEPPLQPGKSRCETCFPSTPSMKLSEDVKGKTAVEHCMFRGRKEEGLPPYLREKVFRD